MTTSDLTAESQAFREWLRTGSVCALLESRPLAALGVGDDSDEGAIRLPGTEANAFRASFASRVRELEVEGRGGPQRNGCRRRVSLVSDAVMADPRIDLWGEFFLLDFTCAFAASGLSAQTPGDLWITRTADRYPGQVGFVAWFPVPQEVDAR